MPGPSPEQLAKSGSEAAQQTALFCWAALHINKYPVLELMFHIPNGGTRHKAEAGRLKAQGVKAGVPDICLPVASLGYHCLWIEMKAGKNKQSAEQRKWQDSLTLQKHLVLVAYTWEKAVEYITYYLEAYYR